MKKLLQTFKTCGQISTKKVVGLIFKVHEIWSTSYAPGTFCLSNVHIQTRYNNQRPWNNCYWLWSEYRSGLNSTEGHNLIWSHWAGVGKRTMTSKEELSALKLCYVLGVYRVHLKNLSAPLSWKTLPIFISKVKVNQ